MLGMGHDIKKATFELKDQSYIGKPVMITGQGQFETAAIKIDKDTKTLVFGEDFEIVPGSYVKNMVKGTAKVTLRGKGEYGGTKTVSFKIVQRSIEEHWKELILALLKMRMG